MLKTNEYPHDNFVATNVEFPSPSFESTTILENDGIYDQNLNRIGWTCTYRFQLRNNANVPIKVSKFDVTKIVEAIDNNPKIGPYTNFEINGKYEPSINIIQANGGEIEIKVPLKRKVPAYMGIGKGISLNCMVNFVPQEPFKSGLVTSHTQLSLKICTTNFLGQV